MKIAMNRISHFPFSALVLAALTSCGGGGYGGDGGGGGGITYTIGGTVTGLAGSGLILRNNGGSNLAVALDGAFTFPTGLANGAAYAVTVLNQPFSPTQNCVVTAGSGTVATSNVTSVVVTCTTATFTVGGVVTELEGSGLVLQNNAGDDLSVSASGAFTFATAIDDGTAYAVTVKTQPVGPAQTCSVGRVDGSGNGTGTIEAANVQTIWVTCGAHFAYAANAGDNTLSQFTLNALTGELTAFGAPVATGTSPYAITGSPDERHVYVVNQVSNNISAYAVNAASGALTEIAGSPFAAGSDPQALAFNPSGTHLYVANNGSNNLSAYSVDAGAGTLTPLATATYATGTGPSAIAVDHSGEFVYVANNGGSNNISVFAVTAGTGALTPVVGSPFAAGGNPHSLSVSASSFLYTANTGGAISTISIFSVNPLTGVLTPVIGSPFAVPVSNYMNIYSGLGDSLFVTTGNSVVGYFVDPQTGLLTSVPGYSAATGVNAFSVAIDSSTTGRLPYLYVGNDGGASVSAFRIDDIGGTLTAVPGSPFAAGNNPDFIAIL